jgi:hypothetical protein
MYELVLYLQEDVVDELNANEPEVGAPTNYIVPNPHAFNADHMLHINRQYTAENAEWNEETRRWEDEGGYYNSDGEYYPFNNEL